MEEEKSRKANESKKSFVCTKKKKTLKYQETSKR